MFIMSGYGGANASQSWGGTPRHAVVSKSGRFSQLLVKLLGSPLCDLVWKLHTALVATGVAPSSLRLRN